jgi:hypothetical protein
MREGAEAGRMIAIVGDAELDEGNIHEALIESWKHDIRNTWWIIDYNRQSLDAVISDRLFAGIESQFKAVGWRVVTLKYGKRLRLRSGASTAPRCGSGSTIVPTRSIPRSSSRAGAAGASTCCAISASCPASASCSTSMTTTVLRRS